MEEIIKSNNEQINVNKNCNYIIGNCQNSLFQNINKLNQSQNKYNVVVDFQTFMRLIYSEKNKDLENDVREKHFKKIPEFANKDINKLILMVDYVFILNVKEIMQNYYKDKEIIIKPTIIKSNNMEEYLLFVLSIDNNPTSENKNSLLLKDNLIFYDEIDLQKIHCINNDFIKFVYEIKVIKEKKDFDYFPFYNAIDGKYYFYLTKKTTNCNNGEIVVLFVDPYFDLEDMINFNIYEDSYNYILILFYDYFINKEKVNYKSLCNYFYNTEKCMIYNLTSNCQQIIQENNYDLVLFNNQKMNAMIVCEEDGRIQYKFKLIRMKKSKNIEEENYIISVDKIIDKKIKKIMKNIIFLNNNNFNVLIDEPFNIIYKYIFEQYKKCKITLISHENHDIKKKISSQENREINDNVISYLSKNKEEMFNVIILANAYDKDYKYIGKDNLKIISNHLKTDGKLCVYMFLKNKYLMERINNEIKDIFEKVSIFPNKSENIFICHN